MPYSYKYLPGDPASEWISGPEFAYSLMHAFRGSRRESAPRPAALGFTTGEDIGIVDTTIPLGPGDPVFVPIGATVGSILAGEIISEVVTGSGSAGSGGTVRAGVFEEREFPEGSIFGPGGVWSSDNREPDFEDPDDTGVVVLPPLPGTGHDDPLEPGPTHEEENTEVAIDFGDILGGAVRGAIGAAIPGTSFAGPMP